MRGNENSFPLFYAYQLKENYFSDKEIRMDTNEFSFDFDTLEISTDEMAVLMGFEPEAIPDPFPDVIDDALAQAKAVCRPTGGFRIFKNSKEIHADNAIQIDNQIFYPDKIVISQLKNREQIAIFACTAGAEITRSANEYLKNGDTLTGFALDIAGSIVADKTALKIQKELEKLVTNEGLNISDRFSPGYCKWNVDEQQKIFSLLPHNFCGIQLSSSSLMWPVKSISGIIGIGKHMNQKGYQCHWCTDKNCFVGKINRMKKD